MTNQAETRRHPPGSALPTLAVTVMCAALLCVFSGITGRLTLPQGQNPVVDRTGLARIRHFAHVAQSVTATPVVVATTTPSPITPATIARQARIFEQFWNIVNERYVYPDFNGIDWAKVREETNQRIAAGITDEDFHALLNTLIVDLNDNHSSFLSPEEAKTEAAEYDGTGTYVGVGIISDLNLGKRYAFVLTVLPGGPAELAGIRPHDHILQIDGQPSVNDRGESQTRLLRGEAGTPVTVLVRTPGEDPRPVVITRGRVTGVEPILQRVITHTGERIGYMLVPSLFEKNVSSRARATLRDLMRSGRLDGLILDLRTNGGGTYNNLRALLGFFTQGRMGSLTNRDGDATTIRVRPERIGNSQAVPLVVLVGQGTESFAEVLAGALQANGRATVIGMNSAGNIETLLSHNFEDGSRLWLAEETYRLPSGQNFEGTGILPDARIDVGWDEFTEQNDPVIAAAVTQLTQ